MRSQVAALGAIVTALAIVALARVGTGTRLGAPAGNTASSVSSQRPAARPSPSDAALAALREGRPIDPNCADAATLELLPGVGPALARRIVEHRAASGPFTSLEALDRVPGVGPKTLARVRPLLAIGLTCPASTTPTR